MTANPAQELVGQVLTDIGAHYEILILRFGEYEIHVSCFARILRGGEILLSTQDYQNWDGEDHKHNGMYLSIVEHGASLIGQKVQNVSLSPVNDLFLTLEKGEEIQIFSSEAKPRNAEESEQWFFYKPKDESYPYFSVSNFGTEQE